MPKCVAIEGNQLLLTQCTEKEKALARGIQCRVWDRKNLGWRFPIRADVLKELSATLKADIPIEARELAAEIEAREQKIKAQKLQGWEKAVPIEPMPIKAEPFQHQVQAYNICLKLLGV